jgi:DNA-binding transcriptional LysR family regulator
MNGGAFVELRHLEHFLAVADCGSFTGAAARVHVVQSTLSVSIRSLETELGTRLFDRSTRTVALTEAGTALVPEARRTLAAADAARNAVLAVGGGTRGTLRIGIMHSLSAFDLAGLLARFHAERPMVQLLPRTHPQGSTGLAHDVAGGELDLAFVALPAHHQYAVSAVPLRTEAIMLACPPGHPLSRQPIVHLTDLAHEQFIDVPAGWGSRMSVDQEFAALRLSRDIVVEVADVATVCQLVRAGLGVALIAPSTAPADERAGFLPVTPPPQFTTSILLPANRELSAAAQAFVEMTYQDLHTGIRPAATADRANASASSG